MADIKHTKEEIIQFLHYYNEWRRGAETEMPEPSKIGIVIDDICKILEEDQDSVCSNRSNLQEDKIKYRQAYIDAYPDFVKKANESWDNMSSVEKEFVFYILFSKLLNFQKKDWKSFVQNELGIEKHAHSISMMNGFDEMFEAMKSKENIS